MVHVPVMLNEALEYLKVERGFRCIDMTCGLGGHSSALLKAAGESGFLLGLDRDSESLPLAYARLKEIGPNFRLEHSDYAHVAEVARACGLETADAILCDCGISSWQLDTPERGFGFEAGFPLDMRMNRNDGTTAAELLNTLPCEELADVFYRYGDEKFSRAIARAVCERRSAWAFEKAEELAALVSGIYYRKGFHHSKVHPATRVFQALRIAVNHELDSLEQGLAGAVSLLAPGRRLGVISFHSGEDRIVKLAFRRFEKEEGLGHAVTKRPLTPGEEELAANPRSRSALFRVFERGDGTRKEHNKYAALAGRRKHSEEEEEN